jgi:hypothetical protein
MYEGLEMIWLWVICVFHQDINLLLVSSYGSYRGDKDYSGKGYKF